METLSQSRQTFIRGRCSLQAELANIPFLKPEKCTTSGGASVYRPLQGVSPGLRPKRRKNYTLSLYGLSPQSWLGNHTGKKKHTREESRFLFKFFDVHTTLVKTLGTLTQKMVKMTHFLSPRPPRFSVDVMDSFRFQHNQHCWGEGYSRNRLFQQHFQAFITSKILF